MADILLEQSIKIKLLVRHRKMSLTSTEFYSKFMEREQ